MAEDGGAGLLAGAPLDLLGQPLADPGEPDMAEGVRRVVLEDRVAVPGHRALGDDHDRGVADLEAGLDPGTDLVDVEALLGEKDDIGAAGQPRVQGDPPGMTAHHLDDEHAHMRFGGGVEPVDGLGGDVDGGVEAEGVVGGGQVVVDGLGDADAADPVVVGEPGGDAEGVLAADRDQRVDLLLDQGLLDPPDAVLALEGVGAGGAEDGAAARQDAAHRADVEGNGVVLERASPAVPEADEVIAVFLYALAHDGADDRVEPGAVTATGQHSDPHRFFPSPMESRDWARYGEPR
ncbi:hypothetical protein SANT12839_030040 [Streptomyces antimycoticus]|uniref:Uncharacterized protein n=1 Tax=Streptomyces antimycoticus TaxID=68175 RepID=A0A4D4K208_9ACTN|nr:hypothetical protein SANT12839_030040 [Streptomyces antimycoticus]